MWSLNFSELIIAKWLHFTDFILRIMFVKIITTNFDAFLYNFNDVTIVYAGDNC